MAHLSGQVICVRRRGPCGADLPLFVGKLAPDLLQSLLQPGDRILNESGQDVEVLERQNGKKNQDQVRRLKAAAEEALAGK